ncbi:MAG: type III secretion system chaperone [Caulobacterales bacterium]|nr:type III secretion system chaperone [Caulobacterales bacterium]
MTRSPWMGPVAICALALTAALAATAEEAATGAEAAPAPMTAARLGEIVARIDPQTQDLGAGYAFTVDERAVVLVYDEVADRMRIMTAIAPAAELPPALLERLLQANFDAALDARYAIAQELVWSVFLHPLSTLAEADFVSGVAQTVTAAETFGATFTSGAVVYGGGDSNTLHRRLIEELGKALENDI